MRTTLLASAVLLAAGCTVANPEAEVGLDEPAIVYAHGAAPGSQIVVHRQGPLDPDGHDMTIAVTDLRATIDNTGDKVRVTALTLTLEDTDMPPTAQIPDGLKIRAQSLSLPNPMTAQVSARGPLVLALSLDGTMKYASGMQLDDGSVYPLGASDAFGEVQLTAARRTDGSLSVRLDAQPNGACANVGDLLTLSNCALSVEAASTLIEPR
jgi:hypothetical protein